MKKLYPVFFAVLIGCSCAFFLFKEVEKNTVNAETGNAVAIQIGVFKDSENANKMKNTYGGIVFEENGLYRVYYSILNKDENIEFITNYLSDRGINYYLKSVTLKDEVLNQSFEYETLMSKTNKESKLSDRKSVV